LLLFGGKAQCTGDALFALRCIGDAVMQNSAAPLWHRVTSACWSVPHVEMRL